MKPPNRVFFLNLFLLACMALQGQRSVYEFPINNPGRIPVRETLINESEISNTYQTFGNIYTTEITGMGEEQMETVSRLFVSDSKVVDAVRFLRYYMEDQLVIPGESGDCSVEMSIVYFNQRNRVNPGSVLGVVTFGIANLLGMPYSTSVADVEIEAVFRNGDDQKITSHRGVGRGKNLLFIYNSSQRKAHQRALRKAIVDLNRNILADPLLLERMREETEQ